MSLFKTTINKKKILKQERKKMAQRHRRKRIDFSFPHIKAACFILVLTLITLAGSLYLDYIEAAFWSSILANLFAGLVTGLILCVISGSKQRTIAELQNKLSFLKELHEEILAYFKAYHNMLSASFEKSEKDSSQYDLIYEADTRANWANSVISQGKFRDILSFNPCDYCKEVFGYDAEEMNNTNSALHEYVLMVEFNKPTKSEVLKEFEGVDKPIRKLNFAIVKEIAALELKLESIEHSII